MRTAKNRMATGKADPPNLPAGFSLFKRSAYLLLCLLMLEIPLGGIAFSLGGLAGLTASLVALLSCVAGGFIALVVGDVLGAILVDEVAAFAHCVFGMLVRAAVGLSVCAVAYGFKFSVSEHGLVYYVLVFYMMTLAVETVFAVRQFGASELAVSSRMD